MTDPDPGPLRLPPPPSVEATVAAQKLRGHSTSDRWLPEGLWPELDELRSKQLRVREQVAAEMAALAAAHARFGEQDKRHEEKLRQAAREGGSPPKDRRTTGVKREAELGAIEERMWASVQVLAEVVEAVVNLYREREDDWLADLRTRLEPAREKRRQAEQLLQEAREQEWQLHQLGQHTQVTADDGPLGRQPAPTPSLPPDQFSAEVAASMLERPWHRRRAPEEPMPSWQTLSMEASARQPGPVGGEHNQDDELPDDDYPAGDPTGVVTELDEGPGRGAAA